MGSNSQSFLTNLPLGMAVGLFLFCHGKAISQTTSTSILTITNATAPDDGNQYRVVVSNTMFICTTETSNTAILTLQVNTVITNRRITYRVNKN